MGNNKLNEGKVALICGGLVFAIALFLLGVWAILATANKEPDTAFDPVVFLIFVIFCAIGGVVYCPIGFGSSALLKMLRFFAYQGTKNAWTETEFFVIATFWPITLPFGVVWYLIVLTVNRLSDAHDGMNESTANAQQWFYKESQDTEKTTDKEAPAKS